MADSEKRLDYEVWEDVLKLQLDGVMMHTTLLELYGIENIKGYQYLHKHHAEKEFDNYLHVLNDYIDMYQKIPETLSVTAPVVQLEGTTMEEKMIKGMELYKSWENGVCEYLKQYRDELSDNSKEHINYLICDVHKELKCINLMENDLYDGKYEELNEWLIKKMGD